MEYNHVKLVFSEHTGVIQMELLTKLPGIFFFNTNSITNYDKAGIFSVCGIKINQTFQGQVHVDNILISVSYISSP